jgi:hypothetical protein
MNNAPSLEHLDNIYLMYYKSKIYLAENHLMTRPKSYHDKLGLDLNADYDLDILFFIIKKSLGYNQLGNRSWMLYVIEITKILSSSKGDKFSIMKLYNKLNGKEYKNSYNLQCFDVIKAIIEDKNKESVLGKLKVLRDKYYAHSDEDFNKITNKLFPTYYEIWDLMDTVEKFLRAIYTQDNVEPKFSVDHIINSYILEFKRIYHYYQVTEDFGELYSLKRNFSKERIEIFRKKKL